MKNQSKVCLILVLQAATLISAKTTELRGQQLLAENDSEHMTPGGSYGWHMAFGSDATSGQQEVTRSSGWQEAWRESDTPEGGISPHGAMKGVEGAVKWDGESKLSKPVQYFFAGLWVLMLAGMPLVMPMVSHQPATKTQKIVGGAMIVVLFGGFFLFTNIILFQSAHFEKIRPLTMVECIYFMSQVITTVGYGDIGPAKVRGQIFVAVYVLGALFVIAMVVSDMAEYLSKMAHEYKKRINRSMVEDYVTPRKPQSIHDILHKDKPSYAPMLISLAVFLTLVVIWVLFFSMRPDEGKSVFQATYMSIITLSSVGLGYFTPSTEEGMIFGAFFMLFGVTALAAVVGRFTELTINLHEWERCHTESKKESVEQLKEMVNGGDKCNEFQFLKFTLMQMGSVSEEEIETIGRVFKNLRPNNGEVNVKDIEDNIMSYGEETVTTPKSLSTIPEC